MRLVEFKFPVSFVGQQSLSRMIALSAGLGKFFRACTIEQFYFSASIGTFPIFVVIIAFDLNASGYPRTSFAKRATSQFALFCFKASVSFSSNFSSSLFVYMRMIFTKIS